MGVVQKQNALSNVKVAEAMRRQVIRAPATSDLNRAIGLMTKHKVNALMVADENDAPAGVISKTDVMGAYYAGLAIETPVSDIMVAPPLFCHASDPLEAALEQMRENGVYRLYVRDGDALAGALAYPDIVGLLYKFCRECPHSRGKRKAKNGRDLVRYTAREVMTASVKSFSQDSPLVDVMEGLSVHRFGAVLIRDKDDQPAGVISKTDLALAYKHGVAAGAPAGSIMSSQVISCGADDFLETAIRTLIFSQVQRIFVHEGDSQQIAGVLSLSDAARIRSGSCHACVSSRIKIES